MRVALVTDYYLPTLGGVQSVVKAAAEGLRAAGHEATVYAPLATASADAGVVGLPISRRFSPDGYPFTWTRLAAQRAMVESFTERGVQVVHVHSEMFAALAAYGAARELGLPVVFTVHGRVDVYGAAVMPVPQVTTVLLAALHARGLPHGSEPVRRDLPYTRTAIARRMWKLLRAQANASDRVLVPSAHLAAKLDAAGVRTPLEVLPNALEDSVLDAIGPAQALPLQPGEPLRAMWCGRVSPEKRPQAFVEAVSRLGGGVTADLFGDGVSRKALATAAQGSGVTLHGAVPQAEVLAAMRAHHVFVSSSVGFDNQPMVMLEAIAAGIPVVYCDPDLAETLPPEGSLLAPTPDAAGIAAALSELASDPARLAAMASATASARRMVSIDTHVARLVAAYEAAKEAPLRSA